MISVSSRTIALAVGLSLLIALHATGSDRPAPDFRLRNFDGEEINLQRLRGKVVILTFSYAFCSARCPIVSARLSAFDDYIGAGQDLVYLHVSVDPGMDTSAKRRNYFGLYGMDATIDKRWMFVSGAKDELSRLWQHYGIEIERKESPDLPEGYYRAYTPKVIVIDKKGRIEYETDVYFSEEELARIIERVR